MRADVGCRRWEDAAKLGTDHFRLRQPVMLSEEVALFNTHNFLDGLGQAVNHVLSVTPAETQRSLKAKVEIW